MLRFAFWLALVPVYAPLAAAAYVADKLTDGRCTGQDYEDPYNCDVQSDHRRWRQRSNGTWEALP